ncbi:tumor necrosis factor receptor superfamily member 1B [Sphaeramia orbicularis]|uniref:Tumor necrosis factor receptor superfamily member 1B-like n=1 Tax=Sphaeramia orbicularis TaxID=375764 RepID=A0A673A1Q9_9TELE|nr:tumor necrosis factor receptor superfamily member 1B-like [Sphaeramia orbicularis]
MTCILVLLVLLSTQATKVCSLPSVADSDGNCEDTKYRPDGSNLCCNKCPPGERLVTHCSETHERVCEPCASGQYMEHMNYNQNCLKCVTCKEHKGLKYARNCSPTTSSKCICQTGKYCIVGFKDPYCSECVKYKVCKVGYGVSVPGTADSNVKCERCPDGTFSDTVSFKDACKPHTNCNGRAVVTKGNATSDTVCEPGSTALPQMSTEKLNMNTVLTSAGPLKTMVPVTSVSQHTSAESILPSSRSVETEFANPTKSQPQNTGPGGTLAAAIGGVIGFILLFIIIIITVILCKPAWKKDAEIVHPKVDANGNCESGDKVSECYPEETQLLSFKVMSPEQQCLLEKGEACSDHSQNSNSDTLTQIEGCSSHESIGPLQSTLPLHNPQSILSEPMTLQSTVGHAIPQPSMATQSSSQPTSPQIISPMTTSPHVNVNITFHIGNGTCGSPSVMPTDLMQVDPKISYGEEEESISIPQQEAGKHSQMSVEESLSCST